MPLMVDIQSEQLAEFSGFVAWLHLVDKASGFDHEIKLTMTPDEDENDTLDPIFPAFVGRNPGWLILEIGDKEQQVNLYENFHSSEINNTRAITEILDMVNISNDVKEKLKSISLIMCLQRTYLIGKEQGNRYSDGQPAEQEYRWK